MPDPRTTADGKERGERDAMTRRGENEPGGRKVERLYPMLTGGPRWRVTHDDGRIEHGYDTKPPTEELEIRRKGDSDVGFGEVIDE